MTSRSLRYLLPAFILLSGLSACQVADKQHHDLYVSPTSIDTQTEIRIGRESFRPVQQVHGGVYTLEPRLSAYVSRIGMQLAAASGLDLPWEFVIINSSEPNAWSLPGGKVAIHRGLLLELNDEAELAAALAHEVAHIANRDTARAIEQGLLIDVLVDALESDAASVDSIVGSGLIGMQVLSAQFRQATEFRADETGMRFMATAGFDPSGATDLQQHLLRMNGNGSGENAESMSHPPSTERLERNQAYRDQLLANLPARDDGAERYQFMTRRLKKSEAAYVNYNVAIWDLVNDRLDAAHERISTALSVENREARFHALHADYHERNGDSDIALEEYAVAVRLEPEYYAIHQGHGLLLKRLGRLDAARASLERANTLLQNAETHEALGDIAVQQERFNDALGHYTLAAQSRSVAGQRARNKLRDIESQLVEYQATGGPERAERRQSPN